ALGSRQGSVFLHGLRPAIHRTRVARAVEHLRHLRVEWLRRPDAVAVDLRLATLRPGLRPLLPLLRKRVGGVHGRTMRLVFWDCRPGHTAIALRKYLSRSGADPA